MHRLLSLTIAVPLLLATGGCGCFQVSELRKTNHQLIDQLVAISSEMRETRDEIDSTKAALSRVNYELAEKKR